MRMLSGHLRCYSHIQSSTAVIVLTVLVLGSGYDDGAVTRTTDTSRSYRYFPRISGIEFVVMVSAHSSLNCLLPLSWRDRYRPKHMC